MPAEAEQLSKTVTCRHCGREYRGITVRHLRRVHGYEGDHPIEDYKRRFNLESALCGESRQRLSRAKSKFWSSKGQGWTRGKLIAEIRRRHRTGKTLRSKQVPLKLYLAGRRHCGTWREALAAAGLTYEEATGHSLWTPERVIAAIRQLAEQDAPLDAGTVERRNPQLFHAAVQRFPRSWAKALRAAGLDPDRHRRRRGRWTESQATDWVRERLSQQRSVLARDAPADLQRFVRNRLGKTWTEFIESFGLPYPGVKKRRDWTKTKLVAEIRDRKRAGRALYYRAVARDDQALLHQARKFFGSWEQALRAAGALRYSRVQRSRGGNTRSLP